MAFSEIPTLDLSEARDEKMKPAFLAQLRDVLLNVGFLYIKNVGIDQDLYDKVCEQGIALFDLPNEEKTRIDMVNEKSFLGYAKVHLLSFIIST
jgi:isopenicillin N synthase-like dioxygenase